MVVFVLMKYWMDIHNEDTQQEILGIYASQASANKIKETLPPADPFEEKVWYEVDEYGVID
jgi:hypothetical protein